MNLTRMSEINYFEQIISIFEKYKDVIGMADQDAINIHIAQYPDRYYDIPCNWNYLRGHCSHPEYCDQLTDREGIKLLHGTGGTFLNWTFPPIGPHISLLRTSISTIPSPIY